jgi:hypothetical protein
MAMHRDERKGIPNHLEQTVSNDWVRPHYSFTTTENKIASPPLFNVSRLHVMGWLN